MMRLPIYLLGFLCLQLVLALGIYWQDHQQSTPQQAQLLLNFNRDKLDKIVITGAEHEQTSTLTKNGDHWILPDLKNLAVSQIQLDSALEKLAALKTNWPIATTQTSHQRFELQEDNFQRRIQLFQEGNKVADVLLGSSPGFRKVYLRVLNDNNVYSLPLNTFDFPVKDADWLDKTLLAASNITAIQGIDYRLTKEQDKWTLQALSSNKTAPIDQDKAAGLAKALSNLRVLELTSKPPVFVDAAVKNIVIEGEQKRHYQFLELNGKYYIKRQDMDHVFSINQADYQQIAGVDLLGLTASTSEKGTETEITPSPIN
jgi:Domain of unknown function (DUF4340)